MKKEKESGSYVSETHDTRRHCSNTKRLLGSAATQLREGKKKEAGKQRRGSYGREGGRRVGKVGGEGESAGRGGGRGDVRGCKGAHRKQREVKS